jgi:amidase
MTADKEKYMKYALLASALAIAAPAAIAAPSPIEKHTLSSLADAIAKGEMSSERAVRNYLQRIADIDDSGAMLNAVLALNPNAIKDARRLDRERKAGKIRGPLHGVPILLKDNIESADPMATTAGSLALKNNITGRDAPLVARLRAAGAVILGKTNLSEWANIRSNKSTSGWSAVGGLTKNPHSLLHNTCGSSAGSGAAMAAIMAAGTVGTETDGSITCPASINGIVGFKPTVGLVSRRFVVPISQTQDTAGPMTLTVQDAALMLTAMAGSDPQDTATAEADRRKVDYVQALSKTGLKGLRVGLVEMQGVDATLIAAAKARLKAAGAIVVPLPINPADYRELGEAEFKILLAELKADLANYLQNLPKGKVRHKTLADIIAFNKANASNELQHFDQATFELAEATGGLDAADYQLAKATARRLSREEGLDKIFASNKLDLIVGQTNSPAWLSTLGKGDAFALPSLSRLPATAGYPHLTVPMGAVNGLPVGLSFIGLQWQDAKVLSAGYAFEQAGPDLRVTPKDISRPKFNPGEGDIDIL